MTLLTNLHFSVISCNHTRTIGSYVAQNEPILGYNKGSKERQELEKKLEQYESKVHDIPIMIGDEELSTGEVKYQVRVSVIFEI